MSTIGHIYALVVGINDWTNPALPKLKGCVNDATLMRETLQHRFGVPPENIVFLTNAEATRQRITDAFREHLIDRARGMRQSNSAAPEPAFVFYYAGHGSRNRDLSGTQPDGMDETIVPCDSRTEGVFDIRDWELGNWITSLTQWASNVTIIMDCCHAGSGTRDDEDIAIYRSCPADLRSPDTQRPLTGNNTGTRGSNDSAGMQNPYTLLAACQSFESAREITSDGATPCAHGAFTWYLVRELNLLTSQREITCRDLMDRVRFQVHSRFASQLPQCEGDRDRLLFGGARAAADPNFRVQSISGDDLWVDAGAAHGISVGARLQVILEGTAATNSPPTMSVQDVEAVRSRCRMEQGEPVPQFSRLRVIHRGQAYATRTVTIDEEVAHRAELIAKLSSPEASGTLKCVEASENAEFRVTAVGPSDSPKSRLGIRDQGGCLLSEPVMPVHWERLFLDLQGLCRYRNLLDLRNPDIDSQLTGTIQVELHQVTGDGAPADPGKRTRAIREVAPIRKTADGVPIVEIGQPIAISVTNQSTQPLYCEVVSLGYDYAVVPLSGLLSAAGSVKRVEPGKTEWFGRDRMERKVVFNVPGGPDAREKFVEAREFLKVFATQSPCDYEILRQDGLRLPSATHRASADSPLQEMFSQVMSGSTRALGVQMECAAKSDWTTIEQEYIVLPPVGQLGQAVAEGTTVALDNYPVSVSAPPGCALRVAVRSDLGTRHVQSGMERVGSSNPAGRLDLLSSLSPVSLASDQAVAPTGTALDLSLASESLGQITPQTPIRLQISDPGTAPQLAIAWNGEFAVPVGWGIADSAQRVSLAITHLPEEVAMTPESTVTAGSRGLGRMVRLYLFRLRNIPAPDLGLNELKFVPQDQMASTPLTPGERCVSITTGELRYSPVNVRNLPSDSRVLLFVPGFGSPASTLFEHLHAAVSEGLGKYVKILTFDYESYRTGLLENATLLGQQLQASGFSASDGVTLDVVGEGMGALVVRAMVELQGGRDFVDRCCLIGTLNQGTPLMKIKDYLPWLGALAINAFAPVAANAFLTGLAKSAEQQALSLSDLQPNSSFLIQLEQKGNRGPVKYHLVAGRFVPSAETATTWQKFWNCLTKVADGALDLFFSDQHDMVASVSSLTKVSTSTSLGTATMSVVPCHHFEYLQRPEVSAELRNWIGS